jgi:hypothetical protein
LIETPPGPKWRAPELQLHRTPTARVAGELDERIIGDVLIEEISNGKSARLQ